MVYFIYGRSGTGKTDKIMELASKSASNGKHVYIIVPDRQTVSAEKALFDKYTGGIVDVVDFKRLAEFVFKKNGGICGQYIGNGAKKVIMHSVLKSLSGSLKEYGKISLRDVKMISAFVNARRELTKECIGINDLVSASEKVYGKTKNKLLDLILIFSEYDKRVEEKWKDPDGLLSKVNELLTPSDFFKNTTVFLDGFKTFNSQEKRIIDIILSQASDVYFSFGYNDMLDEHCSLFYDFVCTRNMICSKVKKLGLELNEDNRCVQQIRQKNDELAYLSKHFWSAHDDTYKDKEVNNISITKTSDIYSECEAVAIDILKNVKGKEELKWRDFAIVARNLDVYRGVLDAILEKYKIPFYNSDKVDITSLSLVKFIMSVLDMAERGIYGEYLISYIKTDFCGITQEESFNFENYIKKWKISGKKLLDEFVENPRGFVEDYSSKDIALLTSLNETRKKIIDPLASFISVYQDAKTVKEKAQALYEFVDYMGVSRKINESAKKANENLDFTKELILKQVWRIFCDSLDVLVTSIGDLTCNTAEFKTYLKAVFSETKIGSIPMTLDEVVISDAASCNVQGTHTIYMIGCEDGSFPKSVGEEGIFTEQEKEELSKVGIELTSRVERRLYNELFFFYQALSSAKEKLNILYVSNGKEDERSIGVTKILEMFSKLNVNSFDRENDEAKVWDYDSAFAYYVSHDNDLSNKLLEKLKNNKDYKTRLDSLNNAFNADKTELESKTIKKIIGKKLIVSSTSLNSYVDCHFAFFCKYYLKLNDTKSVSFENVDIGKFVHKLLEITIKYVADNPKATDKEIDDKISETSESYIKSIIKSDVPARIKQVTDYLCKCTKLFINDIKNDFANGKFKPSKYELAIKNVDKKKDDDNKYVAPIEITSKAIKGDKAEDGVKVYVEGKIDRVDTYEDDNGQIHVLISDYKTGTNEFKIKNIELGRDLQMMLYLYSICNGDSEKKIKLVPAGVSYVGVKANLSTVKNEGDIRYNIKQSGFIYSDEKEAVENTTLSAVSSVDSSDRETNKDKVINQIISITSDIIDGNANSIPDPQEGHCKYCEYGSICRATKKCKK